MRRGCLALGLLALPAAARAQIWPLQVGPGADALALSAAQFERFRREAPPAVDRPTLPPLPAALGPGWMPPPLPAASPPAPRSYRAAAPRRAPAVAARAPDPAARTPDLATVERRLSERERSLAALQRDLAEERRLVEALRSGQATTR
ncbi:hypothetical protein [Roseicella aquatilis]|uniref:Uncharacterized protein n=1 Tax=Roseicella aquatilis TaxID=2527868 RepID=A0A4V2WJI4_9PROT|nr:hypothetical protein [Roseicella aquatilis]TCZ53660.1 hypothetical protein EXY23_24325 [Roseicella aquatilis]